MGPRSGQSAAQAVGQPLVRADIRFRDQLPDLHFLTNTTAFDKPTPILVSAMLYLTAINEADPTACPVGAGKQYLTTFRKQVGDLVANGHTVFAGMDLADCLFKDILGIILVGLLAIGWIESVDTWISVGHRLLLRGSSLSSGEPHPDWRSLWEGLRVGDGCVQE